MAGQPNIRWRKADNENLTRAVRNYNAKIARMAKKDPGAELPPRISIKDIRADIQTRSDFNDVLRSLRAFSSRGGESSISVLKTGSGTEVLLQHDIARIERAGKKFNAKVRRLTKSMGKDAAALPKLLDMKKLKSRIQTRADMDRELDSLNAFLRPGAEEIVEAPDNYNKLKLTRWQLEDMNRRAERINERRQERREMIADIEITDRGEKAGYKKGDFGMGKLEERELDPVKPFTHQMNRADLDRKLDVLRNESRELYWNERDEILRRNYIKSLTDHFRESDVRPVVEAIQRMPFDQFRKRYEAEGGNFELNYPKSPDSPEYQDYLTALKAIWTPDTGNS